MIRFGEDERQEGRPTLSGKELLVATFRHMKKKKQILIIPLTFWSGIEQGFFGADFTAVSGLGDHSGRAYNDFYSRDLSPAPMEFTLLDGF